MHIELWARYLMFVPAVLLLVALFSICIVGIVNGMQELMWRQQPPWQHPNNLADLLALMNTLETAGQLPVGRPAITPLLERFLTPAQLDELRITGHLSVPSRRIPHGVYVLGLYHQSPKVYDRVTHRYLGYVCVAPGTTCTGDDWLLTVKWWIEGDEKGFLKQGHYRRSR